MDSKNEIATFGKLERKLKKLSVNFFHNALNIKNSENIKFADIHRMPKQPVLKNGKKIQRPIIVKLTNLFDKQLIYKSKKPEVVQ